MEPVIVSMVNGKTHVKNVNIKKYSYEFNNYVKNEKNKRYILMLLFRVCERCHKSRPGSWYRKIGHDKHKKICKHCDDNLKILIYIIKTHPDVIITKKGVQTTMTMYYPKV